MKDTLPESPQRFIYNKALETKIGKRTGAYVRKSNIQKDADGLYNMDGYWETTTEKMSIATTDHETSMTSDILVDASDTEGPSSRGSSPKPRGAWRKRNLMQLSSQKDNDLRDLLNGSQNPNFQLEFKDSTQVPSYSGISKKGISSMLSSDSKEPESARRGNFSASKPSKSFISNVTHLTSPPSVSMSPYEDDSTKKDMAELLRHNDDFSTYFQNLQGNKDIAQMRNELKKINDAKDETEEEGEEVESPTNRRISGLTSFSFLASGRKLDFKEGKENHGQNEQKKNMAIKENKSSKKVNEPLPKDPPKKSKEEEKQPVLDSKVTQRGNKQEKNIEAGPKKVDEKISNKPKGSNEKPTKPISQEDEIAIEERRLKEKLEKLAIERAKDQLAKNNKKEPPFTRVTRQQDKISPVQDDSEEMEKSRKKKVEIPKKGNKGSSNESSGNKQESPDNQKRNKGNDKKSASPINTRIAKRNSDEFQPTEGYDNDIGDYGYEAQGFDGQDDNNYHSDKQAKIYEKKTKTLSPNLKSRDTRKPAHKDKSPEKELERKDLKRLKKNKSKSRSRKNNGITVRVNAERPKSKSKSVKDYEKKPRRVNNKKRKRDKFIEDYDRAIGANDMHLIEHSVKKSNETFAGGRYPKRLRLPKFCFWKNERPVYMNRGQGLEIVRVLFDEAQQDRVRLLRRKSSSPHRNLDRQHKSEKNLKSVTGRRPSIDEDSEEEEKRINEFEKNKIEYKLISEDAQTITAFLKVKPQQEKDSQKNAAGDMKCTIIKCEDKKVEVTCKDKTLVLSVNDKFIIPANYAYSLKNKSKYKDLEISCHIMKC